MYPNSAVVVKDLRIQAGCGATLSTTLQGPQLGQTTLVRMSEAQWQNLFPLRHLRRPFSRRSHQQLRPRNPLESILRLMSLIFLFCGLTHNHLGAPTHRATAALVLSAS